MPRRRSAKGAHDIAKINGWWKDNMSNILVLLSIVFGGLGFYFSTTSTLQQHSKSLDEIKVTVKAGEETRDKLRDSFIQYQKETATGIGTLNTETKVQSVELRGIKDSLDKLSRTLEASAATGSIRRR